MKTKPVNLAILAVAVILLGIFIYAKLVPPQEQPAPGTPTSNSPAAQEIESGKQNGESMWLLFRSDTCPPCREMKKIYDRLEPEYKGKVRFISIDVDNTENAGLAKEYGITYIPATFIIDSNGELSYQEIGLMPEEDLRAELDKVVKP
jgi:thiol-disulfide isomerase/thioredoxin